MKDSQKVTAAYTPGPWQQTVVPKIAAIFDGASGWHNVMGYSGVQIETEDGYPIALVAPSPTDTEIGSGLRPAALNARLIAAAPDLLGALEHTAATLQGVLAAVERESGRGPAVVYESLDAARAAIAKARG